MLPPAERKFALPPEPRAPWVIWLVSAVLQVGMALLLVTEPQVNRPPDAFEMRWTSAGGSEFIRCGVE